MVMEEEDEEAGEEEKGEIHHSQQWLAWQAPPRGEDHLSGRILVPAVQRMWEGSLCVLPVNMLCSKTKSGVM